MRDLSRMADLELQRGSSETGPEERPPASRKCTKPALDRSDRRRRRPFGFTKRDNKEIYVTNKTNFKAHLKKCEELFDTGASEVIIHGLGAAIPRACNLALQLKEIHHGGVELDIKTSTVSLVDDFPPQNDDDDYEVSNRRNSAVHIRVFRTFLIGGLRYQD